MGVTAEVTAMAVGIGVAGAASAFVMARCDRTPTSSVVVRAGIVVAGLSVAASAVLLASGPLDLFGVAHLLYLVAVIGLPITGLGLVVAALVRRPVRRSMAGVGVVLVLLAPIGVWSTHVAPFRLREDRATVTLRPGRTLDRPLRIGVLSDLQNEGITSYERTAVDRLMAQDPDVILIAGDFLQGDAAQFRAALPAYRALLRTLQAPGGVYAVGGDVDGAGFEALFEGTGVVLLQDEVAAAQVAGQRLVIGGVRLDYAGPASQAVYEELQAERGSDPVVLLAHRPDAVRMLDPGSRVDLTVAGHTHGGQIALPLVGPIVTMSDLPRSVGAGGLHQVDGNALYVSTGIGVERANAPQIRFLTRPSYGIVEVSARPR